MGAERTAGGKRLDSTRPRLWPLLVGMAVYAILFAAAALCGLYWLWDFIGAYERSRPEHAVNSYMQELSANHIGDMALLDLLERVDLRVQDVTACRRIVLEYLDGETVCKKDPAQSTQYKQVFTLHHGEDAVGSFQIEQRGFEEHGFTPWAVTAERFDLSFLITEAVSATVPQDYHVLVNGEPLPETCIAEDDIPFEELDGFDGAYAMPHMARYEAGPFLGPAALSVTDAQGQPVDVGADAAVFLNNCSAQEYASLDAAVREFLYAYVCFTTNAGNVPGVNLDRLLPLLVPDGDLSQRMRNAVAGLKWVTDRHATVTELTLGTVTRVSQGLFLCDVRYTVSSVSGTQEDRSRLMFRQTGEEMLLEAMEQLA